MEKALPPIPAKRYFTIGEVSELCGVKPHVLRYWEQEFTQLKPMKRRGNRRYYQHHEVLLIRRIRELLYDQGFTISGARNRLPTGSRGAPRDAVDGGRGRARSAATPRRLRPSRRRTSADAPAPTARADVAAEADLRAELMSIRELLHGRDSAAPVRGYNLQGFVGA
ncbi:MAG: MerR family transcriptional regulator [Comamonadaceae bacterium]|nr:MerR family transcriptional regulator [Comamonadaceae bacterium]